MPETNDKVIHPVVHHINLKTTRLKEMIEWYGMGRRRKAEF